ncbi:hypothetical protein ACH5RR_019505 [Cinchona calisaya]|uniref:RING-type domain-containing protein n=1 Tax=Cinchona calisaya TaxID=153742 RepID=A0ABD2ZPL6_9GENT
MPPKTPDANTSRRRKMKEVADERAVPLPLPPPTEAPARPLPLPAPAPPVRYFPLHPQPFTPFSQHQNPNPTLEGLNSSAPFKSFTSLLTGFEDRDPLPPSVKQFNAKIDQMITSQGENLKRMFVELQRRQYSVLVYEAEELAGKKVKETELELSQVVRKNVGLEHREAKLQKENQMLQKRVKYLEDTTASLRAALQEAIIGGGKVEGVACSSEAPQQHDDLESAHVDPDRVEPIMLTCNACEKQVATMMMMWPCRHVSTCKKCEETT